MNVLKYFFIIGLLVLPMQSNARMRGCPSLSACIKFSDIIVRGVITSQEDAEDKTGLAQVRIEQVYKGSFTNKEINISSELFHSNFTHPGMRIIPKITKGVEYIFFIKDKILPKKEGHKYVLYDLEGAIIHCDQPVVAEIAIQVKESLKAETFEIRITGISSCQGNVMLAVYDSESRFMNIEKAVVKEAINLGTADCASTLLYRIAIPYGQYAIVVYHDANSNGIHDKNMFGLPTETWGVSNNARPFLREPKFKECAFTYAASRTSVTIEIQ